MTIKENRKFTLSEQSGYMIKDRRPALKLQGKWLENFGFHIGDQVNVKCENDQLIITKISKTITE